MHTHIGRFGLQGNWLCLCNLLVMCLIRLRKPSSCLSAAFVCYFVPMTYWYWQWREIVTSICLVNMLHGPWHVWAAFVCLNFRLIRQTALNLVFLLFLLLLNISWLYAYTPPSAKWRDVILLLFFRPVFWCQLRSPARTGGWWCHTMWTKQWKKVMEFFYGVMNHLCPHQCKKTSKAADF